MASRSAMARFLIAAVVMLVVVHSASAANNANFNRVSIVLQGFASDYLQVAKRNQFCTSFGSLLSDLQSCVIESAVNSASVTGEVAVTASFAFAAAKDTTTAVVNPLNIALKSATPPTGFVKGAATDPVTAVANQGSYFPTYSAEVEIPTSSTSADATAYGTALGTAIGGSTTAACAGSAISGTTAGTKLVCFLTSRTKTHSELVAAAETAAKTALGAASVTGLYARETSNLSPGIKSDLATTPAPTTFSTSAKFDVKATTVITGTSPTDLNTNKVSLQNALQTAFGGLVVLADINLGTATGSGTTSATIDITISVSSEAGANRVLEVLKQLLGTTVGTTPSFAISQITSLILNPPLFSGAADTVFPDLVTRFSIVVVNTTSAFTTAPYQFRRACEAITTTMQGNASACAIVDFRRPAGNGDAGTLIVDITAANNSAAVALSRSVVRAVAAVPVTTFALGTVTEQFPTSSSAPTPLVAGSVVFTLSGGNAPTTVDAVTAAVRGDICNQLTTANGWVPASTVNCFISEADVVAGATANTVKVTARVWWNIIDYSVDEFVKALNQAKTAESFTTVNTVNYNTAFSTATPFAAGPTQPTPATFVFDVDFHITAELATFDTNANRATFASAIRSIVGNNAVVSVVKLASASGLTPATGTIVTVRVFTPNAVSQGDAFEALAALVAGTNNTIAAPTATYTLQTGGFRAVTFNPAIKVTEFPGAPAPPTPATPPNRPATPPATPPPALPPQAPVPIPQDPNQDPTSVVRSFIIEIQGTSNEAAARILIQRLVDYINQRFPGSIASFTISNFSNFGKKFVVQNYRFTVTFVANSAANAAVLNSRIADAINSGAVPDARVVSFIVSPTTTTPPTTPAAPTAPVAPAAPVTMTSGTIDIVILGTRSSFTQTDQTALTSSIASAINGTASVINIAETSANARKFTMQASALRLTTAVSAPASQYPTVDSIIARLLAVRTSQQGRLGNSAVSSITVAQSGAAARSGPVALTILVALLVAMLSAMAQF